MSDEKTTEVCPARAGMIRSAARRSRSSTSLPRTRGDDPISVSQTYGRGSFAPHARG